MPFGGMISVGEFRHYNHDEMILERTNSHLTIVRNAFAGIPTLMKEHISPTETFEATLTSDIL